MAASPAYAELHCLSNFSFLRGASHPEELVARARQLGYAALALTDECSLAGVVRAHLAAREYELKLLIGAEFSIAPSPCPLSRCASCSAEKPRATVPGCPLAGQTVHRTVCTSPACPTRGEGTCDLGKGETGLQLVLLVPDRAAYGDLSELITLGRRSAEKGTYRLTREDVAAYSGRCLALWLPGGPADPRELRWMQEVFGDRLWIAVELLRTGRDRERLAELRELGERFGVPLLAAGGVQMHARKRRRLHDVLAATRLGTTVAQAGLALAGNAERRLRPRAELAEIYPAELLAETLRVAERCAFSLDELRYEYPEELVPAGETTTSYLRKLTEEGLHTRWPEGEPAKVRALVERELALIHELAYEPYFLTVHDIVRFAREREILCQGRGSAANSAVCFCLGITEVDPARIETLFERFISKERNEPPDIDVDFEHERREEVIQYVYEKYGRDRAALAATVITYRMKSAVRDAGKALGLTLDQVDRLAKNFQWWDSPSPPSPLPSGTGEGGEPLREKRARSVCSERLRECGFDPDNPLMRRVLDLARELLGFPRHLSQHVGGFVIARGRLSRLVPIENAAMPDRTVIQWDKDDLDALGLLKVDCLALGMLTAIRKSFDLIEGYRGERLTMATVLAEDPAVYEMVSHGDTVGVFQIESRAQMAMLPRLRPACFYDLVIETAIVRPGPIQGNMVHPYLRRRQGLEPVSYPSEEVRAVLERTMGVPIFQEQVIKLAMVAAGFSPGEADGLRRSMAAWRRRGGLEHYERRLVEGMRARGYPEAFARQIYQQILGFGEYGFPESHAASFALLIYVSAWLKRHEPAAFLAALLNSQPMGFYSPAQLVQDARRHGVEVRPVDVRYSGWDCGLEIDLREASASHPWRDSCGSDRPQSGLAALRVPLRSQAQAMPSMAWPFGGEKAHRAFSTAPPHPWPGARRHGCTLSAYMHSPARPSPHPSPADAGEGESVGVSYKRSPPAVRLGLRQVKGLSEAGARRLVAARAQAPFESVPDLARRAGLDRRDLDALAAAGALRALSGHRHRARWAVAGVERPLPLLAQTEIREGVPLLRPPTEAEDLVADYASLGLTLGRHPLALLRAELKARFRCLSAAELRAVPHGRRARTAGLVVCRQHPSSASGVIFITLEDETGQTNLIVWPSLVERQRREVLHARLLVVSGEIQREGEVLHVIAGRLEDQSDLLGGLLARSRDFH